MNKEKYGTEENSRGYCEDCGEIRTDFKVIKAYCDGHLGENLNKENKWEELDLIIKRIEHFVDCPIAWNYEQDLKKLYSQIEQSAYDKAIGVLENKRKEVDISGYMTNIPVIFASAWDKALKESISEINKLKNK